MDELSSSTRLAGKRQGTVRHAVARRLKAVRMALGYTQEEMASALGIGAARYSKYEIGRSEASYDVLIKIARLGNVSLDELLLGEDRSITARPERSVPQSLAAVIQSLPIAAVIFDAHDCVCAWNQAYLKTLFPRCDHLVRQGVSQAQLARCWAYSMGLDALEAEAYVRRRLDVAPSTGPIQVEVAGRRLQLIEARHGDYKLVLAMAASETT